MQQSTFAGSRWRHDRDHLSPPQTQVGIRQNADAFLAATIGLLKAARFQNHGGVRRIVGGHSSRELCVLGHSAAGLRASSRAAPATLKLDAGARIPVPCSSVRSVCVRLPKLFPISARPLPTPKRAIWGQTETLIIFLFSRAWGGFYGHRRSRHAPRSHHLPLALLGANLAPNCSQNITSSAAPARFIHTAGLPPAGAARRREPARSLRPARFPWPP